MPLEVRRDSVLSVCRRCENSPMGAPSSLLRGWGTEGWVLFTKSGEGAHRVLVREQWRDLRRSAALTRARCRGPVYEGVRPYVRCARNPPLDRWKSVRFRLVVQWVRILFGFSSAVGGGSFSEAGAESGFVWYISFSRCHVVALPGEAILAPEQRSSATAQDHRDHEPITNYTPVSRVGQGYSYSVRARRFSRRSRKTPGG